MNVGVRWPSKELLGVAEALYRDWVHSDPMPGDLEWSELDDAARESWCHLATGVIQRFCHLRGIPYEEF